MLTEQIASNAMPTSAGPERLFEETEPELEKETETELETEPETEPETEMGRQHDNDVLI